MEEEYCPSAQVQSAGDPQRQALRHFPNALETPSQCRPDLRLLQAEDGTEQATVDPDRLIARSAPTVPRSQGPKVPVSGNPRHPSKLHVMHIMHVEKEEEARHLLHAQIGSAQVFCRADSVLIRRLCVQGFAPR